MSYPINYPTPQGANIQMFSQGGSTSDWVKPQGASFVWFTLIGSGAGGACGDGATEGAGGSSAAVTNFMGPAFLIPDVLRVSVARGGAGGAGGGNAGNGGTTSIIYQQKDGTGYTLLTAAGGTGGVQGDPTTTLPGGAAMTANFFTAMGFFQSIAGQNSPSSGAASSTTFTSAGQAGTAIPVTANYGYTNNSYGGAGFFQTQPIIVSCGGAGSPVTPLSAGGAGGIGSGGGGGAPLITDNARAKGGDGLVVIITW